MAQILDPIPNDWNKSLLCCYVNASSEIQVVRITNIPKWYFERVVFPGQRLIFEALPSALLEVHSGMMASAILSDTIPCERLRIDGGDGNDEDNLDAGPALTPISPAVESQSTNLISYSRILSVQPALVANI
jgi:hypothetical protein